MSINTAVIMGRLTADPELKTTASGLSVLSFSVAVDRNYQKEGEERAVDFITVVAWRKTAEFVSKYFHKGSMIAVEGSIQTRKYEDKDGTQYRSVVKKQTVLLLEVLLLKVFRLRTQTRQMTRAYRFNYQLSVVK